MKRLWLADIHANLPAFEAVLADAGAVDEIVFLGDVIGCGPHPSECLDLLITLNPEAVIGNHDKSILAAEGWCDFARSRLRPAHIDYLAKLPGALRVSSAAGVVTAFHHPPGAPYLHPAMPDDVMGGFLTDLDDPLVFFGHSHYSIDRSLAGRRFVCVPPVGQPRNRDPRAGYALEHDGRLEFRFAHYDVENVVRDIRDIGHNPVLFERWANFLRNGYDSEWSREYASSVSSVQEGDAVS